jgi:hypothetical protein
MYPHERSLVAAMQGRPFALLGVNSDEKKAVMEALQREGITWRSWWDGGSTSGPIASQYMVRGWPTIYVVDHQGVIRYKDVRGEKLEQAVEQLLAVAEVADASAAREFSIVGQSAPVLRKWTDKTGQFSVMAAFVKFRDGKAHLKKEGDQVIEVAMAKLSDEDQQFIRDRLRTKRDSKQ